MASFFVQNFGCRATQADAAAIEAQLAQRGYARGEASVRADVVVLNTCTVTAAADQQARQAIREIHGRNPGARIIVTGCYAQRAPEEVASLDGVTWVVGNARQAEIPGLANEMAMHTDDSARSQAECSGSAANGFFPLTKLSAALGSAAADAGAPGARVARILSSDMRDAAHILFAAPEGPVSARTRPTLKIQDGCDHHCAYCIIPTVRGRSRSMAAEDVIRQAGELAAAGYREIVLSGINLGSYGQDLPRRTSLRELLARLLEETSVEQLRISSIEPIDVTQELIDAFTRTDRLAHHFHMPLQSGSDKILRAMRRWYRAEQYARRVEYLHEQMPDAAIGADAIAGFPGETEDDHRATMEFIAALPFSYLHVFSYSPRPGTEAAQMGAQVPPQVIRRRAKELRALADEKRGKFRATQAGRPVRVLTLETRGEDWTGALSGNYLQVRVAGNWPANQWLLARPNTDDSPCAAELAEPPCAGG